MQEIKILFVEGDKIFHYSFERFVKDNAHPYNYIIAGSVSEAKKSLSTGIFDVVVINYMLCGASSFDLIENINLKTSKVIITGSGEEKISLKIANLFAIDFLIKDVKNKYFNTLHYFIQNSQRLRKRLLNSKKNIKQLNFEHTKKLAK